MRRPSSRSGPPQDRRAAQAPILWDDRPPDERASFVPLTGPELAPIRLPGELAVETTVPLDAAALRALEARQVRVSEAFTVLDEGGRWFRASLRAAGPGQGEARVYERMEQSPEPPIELALYCAVPARQRMMWVVQKAVELGVTHLVPLLTDHSVQPADLPHEKYHAWPAQVLRAFRQCRRGRVPELRAPASLAAALEGEPWAGAELRLFMDDRSGDPVCLDRGPRTVCLAVGPEGGWSDRERELLRKAGALAFRLGGRVLRAETAVLAGLVLLQHRLGDLSVEGDKVGERGG